MQFDEHDIPSNFICPISHCIMRHPVMTRSGHNYERNAILTWLKEKNNTCPMTRKTLTGRDLVSNCALQFTIEAWCLANKIEQEALPIDENDDELLLTCSITDYQTSKKKMSKQHAHEAIIDRAWKKRAEIRNIPQLQSFTLSR